MPLFPSCSYKYHHIPSSIKIPSWWYQHSTQCPSTPCYPRLLRGFGKQLCCFAKMSSLAALRPILQICCSQIATTCRNMSQQHEVQKLWSWDFYRLGMAAPNPRSASACCVASAASFDTSMSDTRHWRGTKGRPQEHSYCDAYWAGCCLLLFVASLTVGISWDQRHV